MTKLKPEERLRLAAHYHYRLHNLVSAAALDGLTVTIEQKPLFPPRIGHQDTVITVRESHASYRSRG